MNKVTRINLAELDQYISGKCGGKEFYFGCRSPDPHDFDTGSAPRHFQIERGKNWIAIRNGADTVDGLLFPPENIDDPDLIIFRGYLSEASINTYTPADRVRKYWSNELLKRHNGIFSAVRISKEGRELSIITDIFGMSPIYIRKIDKLIFFSSTPALLSLHDDKPNMMASFLRLTNGYIPARDTLSEAIELAQEASITSYTNSGKRVEKWYDYETFPKGEEAVCDLSLELSEQKLATAIERCQSVHFGDVLLPLSSGYDSRRLFAHLEKSKTPFGACTVQSLMENGFDIEADCAMQIAKDYNINIKLFRYPTPEEWHKQDIQRIFSMDGQCQVHTWSVPIFTYYDKFKCSFYDGTGGDIFGFNDWVFRGHLEKIMPHKIPLILKKEFFPKPEHMEKILREGITNQPAGYNQNLLTFALWQTRKSSILWGQQQSRPGHIFLYPYLDLDYMETMLRFSLENNVINRPQKAILYKYWPKLAAYRGSREMPDNAKNSLDLRVRNNLYSRKRIIQKAMSLKSGKNIDYIFSFYAKCYLFIAQFITIPKYPGWWLRPSAEFIYWWKSRPLIIRTDKKDFK